MNLRKLTDQILSNGGASYSLTYGNVTKGYAVSPHKNRETQIPLPQFNNTALRNFVLENSDLLANEGHFLGAWIDNNIVYLDVSIAVTSKARAAKICKDSNQLAYFDLVNFKTIHI